MYDSLTVTNTTVAEQHAAPSRNREARSIRSRTAGQVRQALPVVRRSSTEQHNREQSVNYENTGSAIGHGQAEQSKREPAIDGILGRLEKECARLEQNTKSLAMRLDCVMSSAPPTEQKMGANAVERSVPPLLETVRCRMTAVQQCNETLESILSRIEI